MLLSGSSRTDFSKQLDNMNKDMFTVIAWDPRGYGGSTTPKRDWPLHFLERDALDGARLMEVGGWEGGGGRSGWEEEGWEEGVGGRGGRRGWVEWGGRRGWEEGVGGRGWEEVVGGGGEWEGVGGGVGRRGWEEGVGDS